MKTLVNNNNKKGRGAYKWTKIGNRASGARFCVHCQNLWWDDRVVEEVAVVVLVVLLFPPSPSLLWWQWWWCCCWWSLCHCGAGGGT